MINKKGEKKSAFSPWCFLLTRAAFHCAKTFFSVCFYFLWFCVLTSSTSPGADGFVVYTSRKKSCFRPFIDFFALDITKGRETYGWVISK